MTAVPADRPTNSPAARPLTATGTNLLGLVRHLAGVAVGYFGEAFDRASALGPPWLADDDEPDADMWAMADETRAEIVELHRSPAAHSDATIESLPLDSSGSCSAPGRSCWSR